MANNITSIRMFYLACGASVSVWFRSKERLPRNDEERDFQSGIWLSFLFLCSETARKRFATQAIFYFTVYACMVSSMKHDPINQHKIRGHVKIIRLLSISSCSVGKQERRVPHSWLYPVSKLEATRSNIHEVPSKNCYASQYISSLLIQYTTV